MKLCFYWFDICTNLMTKTKIILGISFTMVFAAVMITPALAVEEDFFKVLTGTTSSTPGSIHATVDAVGDIPISTDALGGYAWGVIGNPDWGVFAVTTHNAGDDIFVDENGNFDPDVVNDVRDSKQNPDSWHAHLVALEGESCIASVTDVTTAGIGIIDGNMVVNVAKAKVGDGLSKVLFGFNIVPGVEACADYHPLALQVQPVL